MRGPYAWNYKDSASGGENKENNKTKGERGKKKYKDNVAFPVLWS